MKRFFLYLLFCCCLPVNGETARVIRAPVWVYLESVPGKLTEEEILAKTPPVQELDKIARFVLGGMLYGWKFSYTPSDSVRNVSEFFFMEPIKEIPMDDTRFTLLNIKPEYPRLSCWAEFTLDESLSYWTFYWASVLFKTANGRGRGERTEETEGIKTAYTQAVMLAVREYARKLEKNKPKEIVGEVLLRENPRLFADEGYFVADIRVLINMKQLIPYRIF